MLALEACSVIVLASLAAAFCSPFVPARTSHRAVRSTGDSTKIVESFRVVSDIRYRFATTQMSRVVRNVASKAQQIDFDVKVPKNAFIMAFHMTIDGKRYDGEVKDRKTAQEGVGRGQSAGQVRQAPRHFNVFEVAVNVAAGSAVNFTLTYQEVLRRRFGVYQHKIYMNPGQAVEDFRIEIYIKENRPLKKWKYGNIILVSEENRSRVVLTQCSRRQCPNTPTIKSLSFESGRTTTEIQLNGGRRWQYSSTPAFHVYAVSNNKLSVYGLGLSATIEKVEKRRSVFYMVNFVLHIKGNPASGYSGLLGELMSQPVRLKRLSKKRARNVCKKQRSQNNILVYNKHARKHSVYRARKNLKKQQSTKRYAPFHFRRLSLK
ncbi:inter-alpha-trypsin inhibitor heavy chain H3 [Elysia marginata]|uniref:Inter-alpha-trypsin inhibitor heavy chain H3 n=1 Tax=Elysia marginata TaxID=1093978 RepID=A0AAV4GUU5_9GAST|nr:inter-alpha-trypsin inhibitor heavy chain H3 [Elysia marginata]